jgi:bifunctional non-homologous end joining protein LigD
VAAPVSWSELKDVASAAMFSARDADTLIARADGRGLKHWGVSDQVLPEV